MEVSEESRIMLVAGGGAVDYKGAPANTSTTGGWPSAASVVGS